MFSRAAHDGRATGGRVRRALLLEYRVMAFTTAILLIILVFVGIPLQFAADRPAVVNVVGTMHGFLYIVYLVTAFRLTRRLGIPKWQMVLVLLAGTVPFCAFVAERKMSRRFEATTSARSDLSEESRHSRAASARRRWLSPRALLLHVEVAIVAPGCAMAGWWQATRALAGNTLSWVYSIEWPLFAILALWGWWHLVHEDPEAYRLRKSPRKDDDLADGRTAVTQPVSRAEVDRPTARLAGVLVALIGLEFVLGVVTMLFVPFSRPSGWIPSKGEAVYLAHGFVGVLAVVLATVLLFWQKAPARTDRLVGWLGLSGLGLAGAGGLLTEAASTVRFFAMALMLVGTAFAMFAYLIPNFLNSSQRSAASADAVVVRR